MKRMRKQRDWVGAWFPIMESLGEDTRIPFGRFERDSNSIEWIRIPHEQVDGVGGLTRLLDARGWRVGPMPEKKEARPNSLGLAVCFLRYQPMVRPRSTAWRVYDYSKRGATTGIHWRIFARDETDRLRAKANNSGASLNSFLLAALNESATALFLKPESRSTLWWIPVNMRGLARRTDPASNHSSYIGVNLARGSLPADVHQAIKTQLARRMHWGSWMGIHIGAVIGVSGMRRIMRFYEKTQNCWMGTFTNLGDWPPPGYAPPAEGDSSGWTVSSTVTVSHPIGAACMTWDGQLTLTLQVHPALTIDDAQVKSLFEEWIKRLA
jgi:hypothetical protein